MNKEQFLKMKQLDRIEYLLISDKNKLELTLFSVIGSFINLGLFLGLFAMLEYIAFKTFHILAILPSFLFLFKWAVVVIGTLDIISIILHFERKKKLEERFLKKWK